MRRSSRSVCANIAEAWRKRRYAAAFISKINDAEGEAAETQVHVEVASLCGYLDTSAFRRLDESCDKIIGQLVNMATHPEKWTTH
jgi:four helix bundle protein